MKNNTGVWFEHEHTHTRLQYTHIYEMLKFLFGLIEMFSTHEISIFSSPFVFFFVGCSEYSMENAG